MRRSLVVAGLVAASLSAPHASAATWHRPNTAVAVPHGTTLASAAKNYLDASRAQLKLGAAQLVLQRQLELRGSNTVRFGQRHRGLPVLGAAVVVRLNDRGEVERTVVEVANDLELEVTPKLSQAEALERAAQYQVSATHGAPKFLLAVLPLVEGGGRLVWQIDLPDQRGGFRYLIDALDGRLLGGGPLARHAQGRVYERDPVTTPTPIDVELAELVEGTPQHLTGWDGNLVVTNYVSGDINQGEITVEQVLEPSDGDDFLYDPPMDPTDASDGFAQVNLYHHLTRMKEFWETSLELDMSDPSWKLVAVANMQDNGGPLDNAFFSPEGLGAGEHQAPNLVGIGQGSSIDFALDSDVFLHEFTHYVSHNAVGYNAGPVASSEYGLSPWGGAIDEGISDYFACTENGNAVLGETTLAVLGAARDLEDTAKTCPRDLVGEVHADGEVIGSLGWSLRTEFGKSIADRLVWGATTLLVQTSTLGDFARGVQQTAADLEQAGELTASDLTFIDELITERGLDDCDNVLTLSEGEPITTNMIGLDIVGQFLGGDCDAARQFVSLSSLFHFKTTPDPDAKALRIKVDLGPGGGDLDWGIYVREGQHVGFRSMGFIPQLADYDLAVEQITERRGELVIDELSDPPFDPTQDYYLVLSHQNCPLTTPEVSVENLSESPNATGGAGGTGAGGSAGAGEGGSSTAGTGGALTGGAAGAAGDGSEAALDGEGGDDGGCGCSVPGSNEAPSGLLLALGLGLLGLRRRRD